MSNPLCTHMCMALVQTNKTTMNICKQCGDTISDKGHVIRVYGKNSMIAINGVCSALCYAQMTKKPPKQLRDVILDKVKEILDKTNNNNSHFLDGIYHNTTPILKVNFSELSDFDLVDTYTKIIYYYSLSI